MHPIFTLLPSPLLSGRGISLPLVSCLLLASFGPLAAQEAKKATPATPAEKPAAAQAAATPAPSEETLKKLLPGKWQSNIKKPGYEMTAVTEYRADGTTQATGEIVMDGTKIPVSIEGGWKLKGNVLFTKITDSSDQDLLPEGTVTTDLILSITEQEMRYRDEEGEAFTDTRVTGKSPLFVGKQLTDAEYKELVLRTKAMYDAMLQGNNDLLMKSTHPSLVEMMGGKETFLTLINETVKSLKANNVTMGEPKYGPVEVIYDAGEEEVCFLPKALEVVVEGKKTTNRGYFVAVRNKKDQQWKFLDAAGLRKNPQMLWQLLPKLDPKAKLPD